MPPYQAGYPLPVYSCSYPSIYPSLNEYLVQNSSEETREFRPGFPARSPTDFYNLGGGKERTQRFPAKLFVKAWLGSQEDTVVEGL